MENVTDKTPKPAPATDDDSDKWNAYDYYDCRSDANTPKPTPEYIANTMPWAKEAIAAREAELRPAKLAAAPRVVPKKA